MRRGLRDRVAPQLRVLVGVAESVLRTHAVIEPGADHVDAVVRVVANERVHLLRRDRADTAVLRIDIEEPAERVGIDFLMPRRASFAACLVCAGRDGLCGLDLLRLEGSAMR